MRGCNVLVIQPDGADFSGSWSVITLSAAVRKAAHVSGGPTGTVTTNRLDCCWRTERTAARMVAPMARPSTTIMAERLGIPFGALESPVMPLAMKDSALRPTVTSGCRVD